MNLNEKMQLIKEILVGVTVRCSLMTGALCEESKYINLIHTEEEAEEERKKALGTLARIEKDLKDKIQQYRKANKRVFQWSDGEIVFILVFFANIFTSDFRSFNDSQETRRILGDHLEGYLPLLESVKNGNLSRFWVANYSRVCYTYELKEGVTPEQIIDFLLK